MSEYPSYYSLKASLYEILNNYNAATAIYLRLLKDDSENGSLWLGLGAAYQGENKENEASNAFTKALTYGGLTENQQAYIHSQLKSS